MSAPRVTILDYGAGNLHSLAKALVVADADVAIESDPVRAVADTDALILPGVGAFGAAAARLLPGHAAVRRALADGLPCLGICLGMQLLFDASDEGRGLGLGIIPGTVTRLRAARVPQIGWNAIDDAADPLFDRAPLPLGYFANSFVCRPISTDSVVAWSTHEADRFPAAVRAGRTVGVQFHPEKSSRPGLGFLRAFLDEVVAR